MRKKRPGDQRLAQKRNSTQEIAADDGPAEANVINRPADIKFLPSGNTQLKVSENQKNILAKIKVPR
jgi:hypothetical protein